jgi:WD40 repeat protein
VNAVDLSDDGRLAVTGSDDLSARVWDLSTGRELQRYEHAAPVRIVAVSPSSRYVFTSCTRDEGQVWDAATGERVLTLGVESGVPGRLAEVTAATFSGDDRYLIVGDVQSRIALWDVLTGQREMLWQTEPSNAWQSFGHAVLAVGFAREPGVFYALAGDGRMAELRKG